MRADSGINNAFYDELGERWHAGDDHPIALLRVEARWRNPWVLQSLKSPSEVLDLGCGAGFLANELAAAGHSVTGLDRSESSLAAARDKDRTGTVRYLSGDLLRLPFPDGSFDAVCAMDVLEHVEEMDAAVAEASRVLRPGGLFLYYTFNRTPLAWLLAVKGVEWCIANSPKGLHVWRLLVKPSELRESCARAGLETESQVGFRPVVDAAFWRLVRTRRVPEDFRFTMTTSLAVAYLGRTVKRRPG